MTLTEDRPGRPLVTGLKGVRPAPVPVPESAEADPAAGAAAVAREDRAGIFQAHRGILFGIAYRMLGSVADAEDLLQETFVRWQQSPRTDIDSPRAFLVTILTRLCINHLESARVRREQYYGPWLPEPLLTEHVEAVDLELDDSLSLAFLVLLERLSPAERAVLLLRDVLDYEYAEVGKIIGQSEANCRQLLRRARQHVATGRARFDATHEQRKRLLTEFRRFVSGADAQGLIALLAEEVVLRSDGGGKAPALPVQIVGADKVARALIGGVRKLIPRNLVTCEAQVNGHSGLVSYLNGRAFSVLAIDVAENRIQSLYIISNPDKLAHLAGLAAKGE